MDDDTRHHGRSYRYGPVYVGSEESPLAAVVALVGSFDTTRIRSCVVVVDSSMHQHLDGRGVPP